MIETPKWDFDEGLETYRWPIVLGFGEILGDLPEGYWPEDEFEVYQIPHPNSNQQSIVIRVPGYKDPAHPGHWTEYRSDKPP